MSLETTIKDLINSPADETQLLSIRLPSTTVNFIDELASEVGKTRSELITVFIDGGVKEMEKQLSVARDNIVSEIENSEEQSGGNLRYFLLNTNWNNSQRDHYSILEGEEASAFYSPAKKNIDYLREGDCVFLYQSGKGICAYGFADKELIKRDHEGNTNECHSRKLSEFKRIKKPITAKACKDATKSNLVFRNTMSQLTKSQGEALIAVINQNL